MISIIVAADQNGAIGAKNKVPWRLRDDLVRLKELVSGHTVILGRKTYDSMAGYYDASGRPMPGRTYIVVSRSTDYQPSRDNARAVHSIEEAMTLAKELGDQEIFVNGGGEIYKTMLPLADRVYLSQVQTKIDDVDAVFPALDLSQWSEVSREHHSQDDRNEFDYDVVMYDRR
ncbi:MAG: Dihydrofolate reductase [Candidatus Saccharibacteria bacterium]|nr:Dihydrofolate reductase [Candidatus Saccharibacteria bacterium]